MKLILLLTLALSSTAFAKTTASDVLFDALGSAQAEGDCGAGTCGIEVTDVRCEGTVKKAKCDFKTTMTDSHLETKGRNAVIILKAMLRAKAGNCDSRGECFAAASSIDCTYHNGPTVENVKCSIAPQLMMQ